MQIVSPENIASIMGIMPLPHTFSELDGIVRSGLPKSALRESIERIGRNTEERKKILYSIIAEATFKRRSERLTPGESERAERLARIFATAKYVWDSDTDGRDFLHTPHPLLENQTPLDVSMTELGARRVEELLWQLFYGLPA